MYSKVLRHDFGSKQAGYVQKERVCYTLITRAWKAY